MIQFRCKYCGQKISVPEIHAGKKGKCPKCNNVVVIPEAKGVGQPAGQSDSAKSQISSKHTDLTFLDVPPKEEVLSQPTRQDSMPDESLEDLQEPGEGLETEKSEPVGKRKLSWLIDIFLYPISIPGLTVVGIIIVIPLLIDILVKILSRAALVFLPLLVFSTLFKFTGFIIKIILWLYMYWYFCECIRDSADGGLRAPDVLVNAPSLGDMFWQTLRIVGCLAFFCAPALIYYGYTREIDAIFWALAAYAAFFFPMGLLAVVMFDSFTVLNPILFIGSIFSTFLPYCAMVLVFVLAGFLITEKIPDLRWSPALAFIFRCVGIYLAMVVAHVLGWFYHRYQDKLNWGI